MKKIILTIALVIATLSLVSCKDWLDINYSPNSPSADMVDNNMILPAAEMALAACYGDQFNYIGGYFAEHYTQFFGTSNYLAYSQFTISSSSTNVRYQYMNAAAIANATVVRDKAKEAEDWGTYLAATVLRAFSYQVLVDAYGETPYSEAQQGGDNLAPKYDEGADVYAGLVAELDEALSHNFESVATNMLFSGEGADSWVKFANALKLKLLMRERAVASVDDQLTALVNQNNFPTKDVAWSGFWADEVGKANPFYQEEFASYFGSTQINVSLNCALLNTMEDYADGRLQAFFSPNEANSYWGGISGYNMSTSNNYKAAVNCRPNYKYNTPVYLISVAEVEFFLSEYYRKVANNAAAAKSHYEAAIEASFATAGVSGANSAIAAWPYDGTDKSLGVQKWVALSGINGFEAWCEMRRLGYPAFSGLKAEDLYDFTGDVLDYSKLTPGELYTPYQVDTQLGANKLVQRFPYAQSSLDYNANHPEVKTIDVPVFWAK